MHQDLLDICDMFWDVKMEINIFGIPQKPIAENCNLIYTTLSKCFKTTYTMTQFKDWIESWDILLKLECL